MVDTRKTYTTPSVVKPKITEQQVDAINAARRMMLASLDEDLHSTGHLPRFAQRIDDEYYGQGWPMDYILRGHEFMPARMLAWKKGGKIQFAKDGKKITKHQNTSVLPDPIKAVTPSNNQSVGSAIGSAGKFGQFMQGAAKPLLAGASAIETIGDNNRMFGTLKEGVKEATMVAMPNKVARQSDRMILTAGDPYRQAAQRQLNSNPAVTSDS